MRRLIVNVHVGVWDEPESGAPTNKHLLVANPVMIVYLRHHGNIPGSCVNFLPIGGYSVHLASFLFASVSRSAGTIQLPCGRTSPTGTPRDRLACSSAGSRTRASAPSDGRSPRHGTIRRRSCNRVWPSTLVCLAGASFFAPPPNHVDDLRHEIDDPDDHEPAAERSHGRIGPFSHARFLPLDFSSCRERSTYSFTAAAYSHSSF